MEKQEIERKNNTFKLSEIMKNNPILQEYLNASQEFYKLFNINLSETTYDSAEKLFSFEIKIPKTFQAYDGIIHGGTISALLDINTGIPALINASEKNKIALTSELQIKMLNKIKPDDQYMCSGQIIEIKDNLIKSVGFIKDRDGKIYAEGEATLIEK